MLDFRAVYLPYCLELQADGRYAVLNRAMKPIGVQTREWIDYERLPMLGRLPGLDVAVARAISVKGLESLQRIYLYDDSCIPTHSAAAMDAYLTRLERLAWLLVLPAHRP